MNPLRSLLLPLSAGLLLGSVGAWTLQNRSSHNTSRDDYSPRSHASPPDQAGVGLRPPARLGTADADAAVTAWLALPPLPNDAAPAEQNERRTRLRALLTRLPDDRLEPLLAQLAARTGGPEAGLRWLIFDVWTERDAPASAHWALALTDKKQRNSYAALATTAWARTDFAAAYAWSTDLAESDLADHLAGGLLTQLAATDPRRAIELANARGDTFLTSKRIELFKVWAKTNPSDAVRWFNSPDALQHGNEWIYYQAVTQWLARSPQEAFTWLTDPQGRPDSLLNRIAHHVAGDAKAAHAFGELLLANPDLPDQSKLLASLLGSWQSRDPETSLAWLDSFKDPSLRADLADHVSRGWSLSPKTTLELKLRMPEGTKRAEGIAETFAKWAQAAPDEALAWLREHPDSAPAQADETIQGVLVGNLAATDLPDALTRWQALPTGPAKSTALQTIADHWSRDDPAAATRWLMEQMKAADRPSSLSNVLTKTMQTWAIQDPEASLRWLESVQDPRLFSTLQFTFSSIDDYQRDRPDPAALVRLFAATGENPKLRANLLQIQVGEWLRTDYQAARAWLETSDAFTPEKVAQMLLERDPLRR